MNIKKYLFFIVLVVWTSLTTLGQQSNIAQQRRALNAALTLMDKYYVCATIPNDEAYYDFIDLFSNKDTTIFNDLLSIKHGKDLTVEEYAKVLRHDLGNKLVNFRNVRNEGISTENGMTRIRISFDKAISYIDSCGTYYSSSDFYDGQDYRITATLDYDSDKHECKIVSLSGVIDNKKRLGERHFAFQRTDNRDNNLRYNGEFLKFNRYNQALLEGERDPQILKKTFSYANSDMELRPQTNDCQVTMRYKMRRFRLRPYFAMGLGKAFSRDGDDVFSDSKSTGMSFGLDFGVGVFSKRSFSLGVFTGIGFSMSSMDLSYENADWSYNTNADVDGDDYRRHYENLKLSQSLKFSELNIPLYLDFNIKLIKSLSLYMDLGARFDLNMSHKVDATEGRAYVYGMYSKYGNLRLDENWGFNGFGSHQYSNTDLLSSDLIDVNSFTICGLGGIGFRYSFPKIPLSIDAGMNIVMGLTNLIETAKISTPNSETPVVYNTISETVSTEHVRNLTEMLNSVKRQQLRLSIGLVYKF